ncbi:cell division protein FtsX [Clostridium vitabionis]|uniref:cell division protein FtsX n=1 Tax=Clostridium vitabionis TaxID=2784388 RepID=UPI00188AB961|nr:permease-like cell division protein FtsX [Clostridium vitabionis]
MRIQTFFYCVWQGIKNIGRNLWISAVSAASICASIFLFCLFFGIVVNVTYIVRGAEEKVGITVFFDGNLDDGEIRKIGEEIKARPEVRDLTYISAEEAWESFKKEYFHDNEDLAEGFADDNPLKESSSYEIHLESIEDQAAFVQWLQGISGVRKVNYSLNTAAGLTRFNRLLSAVSLSILVILIVVSVFLISSTISTAAEFHREETRIMRLIGATNFMIRAPFVVEGMLIGFAGAALPLAAVYVLYRKIAGTLLERLGMLSGVIRFVPLEKIFPPMALSALLLGVGIGFIGSFFAIRRQLRV